MTEQRMDTKPRWEVMRHAAEQTQFKFTFFKIVLLAIVVLPILGKIFTRTQFAQLKLLFIEPQLFPLAIPVLRDGQGTRRARVYRPAFGTRLKADASERSRLAPAGESADRFCRCDKNEADLLLWQKAQLCLLPGGLDGRGNRRELREGLL